MIVYGANPVLEALRSNPGRVRYIAVVRDQSARMQRIIREAKDAGVTVRMLAASEVDRLAGRVVHNGVAAEVSDAVYADFDEVIEREETSFVLILDGITDPQNFGAVIRSAVGLGATAVVWGEHHAAPLSPATFRASAGAVEHATLVCVPSLRQALSELSERGLTTIALEAEAERRLSEVDLRGPTAIVVGAEDVGVSRGVRRSCALRANLPMKPPIGSLNASVASALALYEAVRQRESFPIT
jgi:23S rRNA (guanosine2251-2'-O)-methyltransferase